MTSAVTGRRSNQLSYEAVACSLKQPSVYITQNDDERKSSTVFGVLLFSLPPISIAKPCDLAVLSIFSRDGRTGSDDPDTKTRHMNGHRVGHSGIATEQTTVIIPVFAAITENPAIVGGAISISTIGITAWQTSTRTPAIRPDSRQGLALAIDAHHRSIRLAIARAIVGRNLR